MSMLAAQNAAAERLGGSTMWRDAMNPALPDFGAVPDADLVAAVRQPAAPAAPTQPSPADLERQEYMGLLKAGQIDENGMAKNGKMYRGPKAREFAALHGGWEPVLKDKDLAQQLNRITMNENRAFAGLDALPDAPTVSDDGLAAAYPRPENMSEARYLHNLDILRRGKDAPTALTQAALYELSPESTQFGQKQIDREEKRKQLQQKQQKAIDSYRDKMETGLRAIERMRRNLNEGFLPEVGLVGEALRRIPGTDAYELETDLESLKGIIGFEGLMDAKLQSPNGASGFGSLSNDELRMLQGLAGQLRQGGSKESFLERLQDVEKYLRKGLTPTPIDDAALDAVIPAVQTPSQPASAPASPKRYKFTSDGALVGG